MLISRRSPRKSDAFRSRFREGSVDFPLRQYLRCREEIYSGIVHCVLLAAFGITLILFARTVWDLFRTHGENLSPWYGRLALLGLGGLVLLAARRFVAKLRGVRQVRREMQELRDQIDHLKDTR